MKKALPFIFTVVVAAGCQKTIQSSTTSSSTSPASVITAEVRNFLLAERFDTAYLLDLGESYLVEGDIMIDKATIQAAINKSKAVPGSGGQQGHTQSDQYALPPANSADGTGIIGYANTQNITYYIDPAVNNLAGGGDWVNAIHTAAPNWTGIANCSLNYTEVFAAAGAQLIFYASNSANVPAGGGNLPAGVFAATKFPQNNVSGACVVISVASPATNLDGKTTIMRHEMGHSVGMRHANVTQDGEGLGAGVDNFGQQISGANLINVTMPVADAQSVMWNTTSGTTATNFDNFDLLAAQILYPDNILPTGVTFFTYTPFQGGDRQPPSGLVFYLNLGGNTWNSMKIDRLDASGNLLSTATYTGLIQNFTATSPEGIPPGHYGQILGYDRNGIPHGTLYWRFSFYNYKGDFGLTLPTATAQW